MELIFIFILFKSKSAFKIYNIIFRLFDHFD